MDEWNSFDSPERNKNGKKDTGNDFVFFKPDERI
jgi:hypothetical protein